MKRISFLAKLALLFNAVYVIEMVLKYTAMLKPGSKMLAVPGAAIIAPILNLSLLLSLVMIKEKGKPLPIPKWIWATCAFFLIFQAISFLVA